MQTKQLLEKQVTIRELVLRVARLSRRARRSCWQANFPELRWSEYKELELAAKESSQV